MKWKISYSRDAKKFIEREGIRRDIGKELLKFLKKMKGEDINIDVKKLRGAWESYYRIRARRLRIIFDVDYKSRSFFIEKSIFVEMFINRSLIAFDKLRCPPTKPMPFAPCPLHH